MIGENVISESPISSFASAYVPPTPIAGRARILASVGERVSIGAAAKVRTGVDAYSADNTRIVLGVDDE